MLFRRMYDEGTVSGASGNPGSTPGAAAGTAASTSSPTSTNTPAAPPSGGLAARITAASGVGTPSTPAPQATPTPAAAAPSAAVPTSTDPAATGTQTAIEPAAAQAARTIRQQFQEATGLDVSKYGDDNAFFAGVKNAVSMIGQRNADAEFGRQYRQRQGDLERMLEMERAGQYPGQQVNGGGFSQPGAPQQQQAPQPDPIWDPPKYDPGTWQQYRVDDGQGQQTWAPNTPAEVRKGYDDYANWSHRFTIGLRTNPAQMFDPRIELKATEIARREIAELRAEMQAQQIAQQNQQFMYERDPQTQQAVVDPFTQQPRLDQRYVAYQEAVGYLGQFIQDPTQLNTAAQYMAAGRLAIQQQQQRQQQPQTQTMPASPAPTFVPQVPNGFAPMQTTPATTHPGIASAPSVSGGAGPAGTGRPPQMPNFTGPLSQRIEAAVAYKLKHGIR